jgi:hypothetical protein
MKPALVLFLSGMLAAGYAVIAGFFFRFWKQTRDRFFIFFSVAFVLLAIQRTMVIKEFALIEDKTWAYGLRLFAFLLILYAIVIKNRESAR